ncbi:HAMP domain-containing protein [Archangium gephyra]|uniref:histidine kinase n=1 Tax=Archangium gephyra TaxID=48 RepID=A0AAC8QIU4_9BACT|nr:HAMP domain-containing sensor histidine kinase [Archangium gephyra]AKJ08351.1 Chemotaxis protein methyltransferase CheR [Archangium gephyra]REG14272.1 HAMP domain-containing protein [Archangium gephyra]
MSLKRVMTTAVAMLGALALAGAASLILLTTYLHRTTESMGNAVEGVRVAEALQVDLLMLHRPPDTISQLTSGNPRSREDLEAALRSHLDEARRNAWSPQEQALLKEAERTISDYFLARPNVSHLSPEQAGQELGPRVETALAALDALVTFNVNEARTIQLQADRWDRLANLGGICVAVLLVLGGGALLWWLRHSVFRPLLEMSRAMRRFGGGRKRTRAPESGPVELRDMARTFNEMANSLARQQEEQLTFLAGVAHDLRNPLSALKMSAALVTSGRPIPEERMQKTMALVRRQVARLDRMVGDLLDATRIEAGRFELSLEERDARELATAVVELYLAGGSSHDLRLHLPEEPVLLSCDATRVEQVLHNLVSNALKYSQGGSRVDVIVGREGEEAVLSVVDRGIGISTEELRLLFAPFRRTGRAREKAPGVGLGLSVARRIVEAHGGRIEVESRPGVGSTFRVRLPRAHAAAQPAVVSSPADTVH